MKEERQTIVIETPEHVQLQFKLLVAETIIKVARQLQLLTPNSKMGIASFDGSHIDIRIQQLLEQPEPVNPCVLFFSSVLLSLIMCSTLMLTMPLHHLL